MPYVERVAKFAITDGTLAVKGRYELLFTQEKPALRLQEGAVSLKNFKLGAPGAAEPAVTLDSLEVTGLVADSAANSASVAKVAPFARHTRTAPAPGSDTAMRSS